MADSTLAAIQKKVRRLTRSPDSSQLSTNDLNEYINTFIQFDFPGHVRLFNRLIEQKYYTEPNDDQIAIDQPTSIVTFHQPVYIDGRPVYYTQDPADFYGRWPRNDQIVDTGLQGDGVTNTFNGTLPSSITTPILPRQVLFSSIAANNVGLQLIDTKLINQGNLGNLADPGTTPSDTVPDINNQINYLTGTFVLTFLSPPANGTPIMAHVWPYQAARPQSVLWYNKILTLRPVPDQSYELRLQAQVRPTELLNSSDFPDLQQWWQYIAYGAAKKIFEDRMDTDSVQMIMPEFMKQEELVLRTTTNQIKEERVATIYTQQIDGLYRNYNNWSN